MGSWRARNGSQPRISSNNVLLVAMAGHVEEKFLNNLSSSSFSLLITWLRCTSHLVVSTLLFPGCLSQSANLQTCSKFPIVITIFSLSQLPQSALIAQEFDDFCSTPLSYPSGRICVISEGLESCKAVFKLNAPQDHLQNIFAIKECVWVFVLLLAKKVETAR